VSGFYQTAITDFNIILRNFSTLRFARVFNPTATFYERPARQVRHPAAAQFAMPRDRKQLTLPFTTIHARELDLVEAGSRHVLRDATDFQGSNSPSPTGSSLDDVIA
jgi:hypothetical protein